MSRTGYPYHLSRVFCAAKHEAKLIRIQNIKIATHLACEYGARVSMSEREFELMVGGDTVPREGGVLWRIGHFNAERSRTLHIRYHSLLKPWTMKIHVT